MKKQIIYKNEPIDFWIDENGVIYSIKGKVIKPYTRPNGSKIVTLYLKKKPRKQTTLILSKIDVNTGVYIKTIDKKYSDEGFDFTIPYKEYIGKYFITEDGRLWSKHLARWIIPQKQKCGYLTVTLSEEGKSTQWYMHRLMWHIWVEPMIRGDRKSNGTEAKKDINHKDMNKHNNNLFNLELVTRTENQQACVALRGRLHIKEKFATSLKRKQTIRYEVLKIDRATGEVVVRYKNLDEACKGENMIKSNLWGRISRNVLKKKEPYTYKYGEKIEQE